MNSLFKIYDNTVGVVTKRLLRSGCVYVTSMFVLDTGGIVLRGKDFKKIGRYFLKE